MTQTGSRRPMRVARCSISHLLYDNGPCAVLSRDCRGTFVPFDRHARVGSHPPRPSRRYPRRSRGCPSPPHGSFDERESVPRRVRCCPPSPLERPRLTIVRRTARWRSSRHRGCSGQASPEMVDGAAHDPLLVVIGETGILHEKRINFYVCGRDINQYSTEISMFGLGR